MNITRKHKETRRARIAQENFRYSGRDLTDDLSDPVALESWSIEELDDVLASREGLNTSEFELSWGRAFPIEQADLFFD